MQLKLPQLETAPENATVGQRPWIRAQVVTRIHWAWIQANPVRCAGWAWIQGKQCCGFLRPRARWQCNRPPFELVNSQIV